jgi:hypothetical protein
MSYSRNNRTHCRASVSDADWRFTERSRREPSDMDGQVASPSEREQASQTPYKMGPSY